MMLEKHSFELFADYFQFYVQDENADFDLTLNIWTEQTVADLLAVTPGMIHVGTVRNMTVPVTIELHDSESDEDFAMWEQITECSLEAPSGKIVVLELGNNIPETQIEAPSGTYRARIFCGNLDTLSEDGLEGDDNYKIALWRGEAIEPQVLKRRVKK